MAQQKINKQQSLLKYSTSEQLSGDTWIGDEPIYYRTFAGTITQAASSRSSITLIASGVTNIIEDYGRWDYGDSIVPINSPVTSGGGGINTAIGSDVRLVSGAVILYTTSSLARTSASYYVTIYYTKT